MSASLPLFPCRYDLDDITASKHRGSETSEDANRALGAYKTEMRERVFRFIRQRAEEGATTEEVAAGLCAAVHSVSGRISELKREGRVRESGLRRPTRSGMTAHVIVAND